MEFSEMSKHQARGPGDNVLHLSTNSNDAGTSGMSGPFVGAACTGVAQGPSTVRMSHMGVNQEGPPPTSSESNPCGEDTSKSSFPNAFRRVADAFKNAISAIQLTSTYEGKPSMPVKEGLKQLLFMSPLNVLLLCTPVSWALQLSWRRERSAVEDGYVFFFSFCGIIPLASLSGFATEQLAKRSGQARAGLINAVMGNMVELIVAIIALTKGELEIVQSLLIGSILGNILLLLGMCFLFGGLKSRKLNINEPRKSSTTSIDAILLSIVAFAGLLPSTYNKLSPGVDERTRLVISRTMAFAFLILCLGYIVFLLGERSVNTDSEANSPASPTLRRATRSSNSSTASNQQASDRDDETVVGGPVPDDERSIVIQERAGDEESCAQQDPPVNGNMANDQLTLGLTAWFSLAILLVVTTLVALTAEGLIGSLNGLINAGKIPKQFAGLILLPMVGNFAEHFTEVVASWKRELPLSLSVALGSSIQIALFVIPILVILGWILGKPLTMFVDLLQSISLFLSVFAVMTIISRKHVNWLGGLALLCMYAIIAAIFWFAKAEETSLPMERF